MPVAFYSLFHADKCPKCCSFNKQSVSNSHNISGASVSVVGVRTPQKIQVVGVQHPQKVTENIRPTSQEKNMGIVYRQLLNVLRCAKSDKTAHETPTNR